MKVMVVDDNAIVRLGLQSVLQRIEAVHEVIAADSAFSALEAHHAHSPDIILLDISMPRDVVDLRFFLSLPATRQSSCSPRIVTPVVSARHLTPEHEATWSTVNSASTRLPALLKPAVVGV